MNLLENRALVRRITSASSMLLLICTMLVFQFTSKSPTERERARARTMLESVHNLQMAHFEETGTYLSSRRGNTSDVMRWDDMPGVFRYVVGDEGLRYVAVAEADLNGDGQVEVWQINSDNPEPVLAQSD